MYRIVDDAELYRVRCEKCQNTGKTEPTYGLAVLSWNDENKEDDSKLKYLSLSPYGAKPTQKSW